VDVSHALDEEPVDVLHADDGIRSAGVLRQVLVDVQDAYRYDSWTLRRRTVRAVDDRLAPGVVRGTGIARDEIGDPLGRRPHHVAGLYVIASARGPVRLVGDADVGGADGLGRSETGRQSVTARDVVFVDACPTRPPIEAGQ